MKCVCVVTMAINQLCVASSPSWALQCNAVCEESEQPSHGIDILLLVCTLILRLHLWSIQFHFEKKCSCLKQNQVLLQACEQQSWMMQCQTTVLF